MKIIVLLLIAIGIVVVFKMYKTFKSLNKEAKSMVKDKIKEDIIDIWGDQ